MCVFYVFVFTIIFSNLALLIPWWAINLLISKAACTILQLSLCSANNEAMAGGLWSLCTCSLVPLWYLHVHFETTWDLGILYLEQNIDCMLTPQDKIFQFSCIATLSCVIPFNLQDIFSWPLLSVLLVETRYHIFLKTQKFHRAYPLISPSANHSFICLILTKHEIIPQQSKLTSNTREAVVFLSVISSDISMYIPQYTLY